MISGTTFTASAATPSIGAASATTTASAVSVTSCDLKTTSTGSSTSTYCSCNGGYGVSLSTKTNAAKSTFLICAADPAITVTTIIPSTTSTTKTTSKTTSTVSEPTSTGFALVYVGCESVTCPVGETCDKNGDWDFMAVQPLVSSNSDLVQISGTYNKGGMVTGTQAKFCDQTSTFTIDGDLVKGSSSDDSYGTYTCEVSQLGSATADEPSEQLSCTETYQWNCLTNICL